VWGVSGVVDGCRTLRRRCQWGLSPSVMAGGTGHQRVRVQGRVHDQH
jgi:hypothetical protein